MYSPKISRYLCTSIMIKQNKFKNMKTKNTISKTEKAFNIFYLLSPVIVLLICYIKNL